MMMYDKKVHRAGTIPYWIDPLTGQTLMMFMRPSNSEYGGDKPQIAKGRIEEGEQPKTAALREAQEELGLLMSNITDVAELGVFMGRTTLYIAKVKDRESFGAPGYETVETLWLSLDQFESEGRELHVPVVREAYQAIERAQAQNRTE